MVHNANSALIPRKGMSSLLSKGRGRSPELSRSIPFSAPLACMPKGGPEVFGVAVRRRLSSALFKLVQNLRLVERPSKLRTAGDAAA